VQASGVFITMRYSNNLKTSKIIFLYYILFLIVTKYQLSAKNLLQADLNYEIDGDFNNPHVTVAVDDEANDYDRNTQGASESMTDSANEAKLNVKSLLEKYLVSSSSTTSSSSSKKRKHHNTGGFHSSRLSQSNDQDEQLQKQHIFIDNLNLADDFTTQMNNNNNDLSENAARLNTRSSSSGMIGGGGHQLVKKFRMPAANKRAWDIRTYYDALIQTDGSILLIPKDVNKNHYFIG
jgi:hypothetical protein